MDMDFWRMYISQGASFSFDLLMGRLGYVLFKEDSQSYVVVCQAE